MDRRKCLNRLPDRRVQRRSDALLTARADLLGVREALLGGCSTEALRRTDWLIDCIDEYVAEGGR